MKKKFFPPPFLKLILNFVSLSYLITNSQASKKGFVLFSSIIVWLLSNQLTETRKERFLFCFAIYYFRAFSFIKNFLEFCFFSPLVRTFGNLLQNFICFTHFLLLEGVITFSLLCISLITSHVFFTQLNKRYHYCFVYSWTDLLEETLFYFRSETRFENLHGCLQPYWKRGTFITKDVVVCLFKLWAAILPPLLPISKLKILIKVSFVEKKSNIFLNCLLGERNKYSQLTLVNSTQIWLYPLFDLKLLRLITGTKYI